MVSSHFAEWGEVSSDVLQGSLLGPPLFSIYINDLQSHCTNSKCLLYVDDTKTFRPIQNVLDFLKLQDDLHRSEAWCNLWKLDLNVQKCSAISFTNKKSVIYFNYCISESCLKKVN